mmetsp:Transcript_3170/g.4856  ORF Transcript_3170/g.4856 Transcript_3170/m.4856 type:complete len:95 (-) Transcript_3170:153-437(-)
MKCNSSGMPIQGTMVWSDPLQGLMLTAYHAVIADEYPCYRPNPYVSVVENEDGTFSFMFFSNCTYLSAGDGTPLKPLQSVLGIGRSEKFKVLVL